MKAIAVIPAYNEAEHIPDVVARTKPHVAQVIVVDDCSKDETSRLAHQAGALTLRHRANLGKAGAIKTGCDAAVGLGADIIILLDGDGQHNPEDIPRFLQSFDEDEDIEIVFGSRTDKTDMPLFRRAGTKILEHFMRILFHIDNCDMQCGYRAFRSSAYPKLRWKSANYHADAEITARTGKRGLRHKEIPIATIYNDPNKGMTIVDGLTLLTKLVIWKFTI